MKLAIIHQDLEWSEKELNRLFRGRGIDSKLFDIRKNTIEDIIGPPKERVDLVLNRVYASVANRNYLDNMRTLDLLVKIEEKGIPCLNSVEATIFDYSKNLSAQRMKQNNISTPDTIYNNAFNENERDNVDSFIEKYGFPIIMKRDIGGRGKDLSRIENYENLLKVLDTVFSENYSKNYAAGFVLQPFIQPTKDHDYRIAIDGKELVYADGRTLLAMNGESPWIASISNGSQLVEYVPDQKEVELAIKATESIGASFNVVDMTFTRNGPMIIENNPTPGYNPSIPSNSIRIKQFVESIVNRYEAENKPQLLTPNISI